MLAALTFTVNVFFFNFFGETVELVVLCGTCAMEEISRFSDFIIFHSARTPSLTRTKRGLFFMLRNCCETLQVV